MDDLIKVDDDTLREMRSSLGLAGEEYKEQYAKLCALMDRIKNEEIKGDLADDLYQKFMEKEKDFKALQEAIDEAEEKVGIKGKDFNTMVDDLIEQSK